MQGEWLCPLCKAVSNVLVPAVTSADLSESDAECPEDTVLAISQFQKKLASATFGLNGETELRGGAEQSALVCLCDTLKFAGALIAGCCLMLIVAAAERTSLAGQPLVSSPLKDWIALLQRQPKWRQAEWMCTGSTVCWGGEAQCSSECCWVSPQFDLFEAAVGFACYTGSSVLRPAAALAQVANLPALCEHCAIGAASCGSCAPARAFE